MINWFPGHMKKTYDIIETYKDKLDFIIEVIDARAINYSSNKELIQNFQSKKIITIVLKTDLSDQIIKNNNYIYTNKKDDKTKEKLVNKLTKIFKIDEKLSFYNPIRTGMVIGLPNIGKSTLINKLVNKKNAIVMNKPGTTKKITIQKITNSLYLYDAPGIMYKKIIDLSSGYVLCLIGTINKSVIPLHDLMKFALNFLKTYYKQLYIKLVDNESFSYDEAINYLAKKWNLKLNEHEPNLNLVLDKLYHMFTSGEIGKISYDNKDLNCLLYN